MGSVIRIFAIATVFISAGCAGTSPQQASIVEASVPPVSPTIGQDIAIGAAANIAGRLGGVSPLTTQTPALAGLLAQQLGITPVQAMGGAGTNFSVARQAMTPANFSLLNNAVPGMSQLLAAAPNLTGSTGGLMGRAASALGGGSSLGANGDAGKFVSNLGLNAGMVNRFIPIILQYVQT